MAHQSPELTYVLTYTETILVSHSPFIFLYFNDMKGMKRYKADVYFRVGQFTTGIFHIEDKW